MLSPLAKPFMGEDEYPTATFAVEPVPTDAGSRGFAMTRDEGAAPTPWIRLDPADPLHAISVHPPFQRVASRVMRVHLRPGECLYLPSGWYHRVTQSCPTVAVNYWFDRDFNTPWALQRAVESFVGLALSSSRVSRLDDHDVDSDEA